MVIAGLAAVPTLVALDLPLRAGDAAFTFAAARPISQGVGVIVPFGRRLMPGIVVGPGTPRADLRPIIATVADEPMIPSRIVDLARWVASEYLSSIGEALAVATPWDALWSGLRIAAREPPGAHLAPPIREALEALRRRPAALARASRVFAQLDPEALMSIAAEEVLVAASGRRRESSPDLTPTETRSLPEFAGTLYEAPRKRVEREISLALAGGPRTIVVAGPHRTAAYLAAIRRAAEAGLSSLAAFASVDGATAFAAAALRAGLNPGLLHADLSPRMRLASWHTMAATAGGLVVGTRGVVFAPIRDPALVIVDDEDHSGHKEERSPRYVTRAVGAERTGERGILMVGATTPTVSTYADVANRRARLIALAGPRPRLTIIDLRRRSDPSAAVSRPVLDAVRRVVRRRGRAVLITDRKGYAGALQCRECGSVERCPDCGVAMRYGRGGRLRCRLCGRTRPAPGVCSRCGGRDMALLGAGTDRIAAATRRLTPMVWRVDRDALGPGENIAARLEPFRKRGGVLAATPVILPWIETLQADLVAVVGADRLLQRSEFRASERALAFLREIGIASGSPVMIETADPEHPALRAAVAPSLRPFYADELALRERLRYPPTVSLIALTVSARSPSLAAASAASIVEGLKEGPAMGMEVLGPTPQAGPPPRATIIVKVADRVAARARIFPLLIGAGVPRGARLTVDVEPHDLSGGG